MSSNNPTTNNPTTNEEKGFAQKVSDTASAAYESVANTLSAGKDAVSSKVSETSSAASKEANKSQAKNSEAPVGDRITSAGKAAKDWVDEKKSGAEHETAKKRM